jgi:hypothetical protein
MSRKLATILCIFLALLLSVDGFAADTAVISGRVNVENGVQTIYGARLYLYNTLREAIDSTYSELYGVFQFRVQAGEYYLSAEKDNFIREFYPGIYKLSEAGRITVFAGQTVHINFDLDRGGWLGGVFDYVGRDIDKGLVTAIKVDEPHAGWYRSEYLGNDRPANYVLNGLIPGAYKVLAMASVKKSLFYPGVDNIEEAEIITVERNAGVPDISFLLEQCEIGQASGRVYDVNTGEGLTGVSVYAYQWREYWDDPNLQVALTGEDGGFDLDLPEGEYTFYLNCDNYSPGGRIAYYYNNRYNPMLADIVAINRNIPAENIDFAVNLNVNHDLSISGNIIDTETGQGLPDVVVTALDYYTGQAVSSTYSISNGNFALENLPSGEYLLMYSGNNVIPFFYRATESWQDAEVIVLNVNHPGIQSEAITQDYGNLGLAISGSVLTPSGPASGARVYAYPVGEDFPIAFGRTSASGEYTITTGLVPGSFRVACDLFGYVHQVYPFAIELDLLHNPVVGNIDFLLEPAVTSIHENMNLPGELQVFASYPNPFNDDTRIPVFSGYSHNIDVNLAVYNILGQNVGEKSITLIPGINYIAWKSADFGRAISSGVYFYRVEGLHQTHRMLYLK